MKIFCNSQGTQSRDPSVIKHNGKYYWTYAFENRIYIMEAATIEDFANGEGKLVWTPDDAKYSQEVWAPELHVIDGICYIYVACDDGNNYNHRMYVISNASSNPLEKYINIGQITDPTNKWAIDGTILRHNDNLYIVWSGWEGDENIAQNIYIARLSFPTKIDGERVLISRPDQNWEKDWQVMAGEWKEENGWLIGAERGNKGGILFCFYFTIWYLKGKNAYESLSLYRKKKAK